MRNDIAADHAIVEAVADDDRAVLERLAALEAEVKADADAQRTRKAAAAAKLRDRVTRAASDEPAVRNRATDEPRRRTRVRDDGEPGELEHLSSGGDLGGALELASKANRVKQELTRPRGKGDKSWLASGVASLLLGPVGWLYAGSLREAVPAAAAYVALGVIATKLLPMLLLWPVMMVVMPLSGIAGVVYALQHNRAGRRQRLFDGDKEKSRRALPTPRAGARGKLSDET
jgi:hypothetical protein